MPVDDLAEEAARLDVPDEIRLLRKRLSQAERAQKRAEALERIIVDAVQQCYVDPPNLKIPPPAVSKAKGKPVEIHLAHLSDIQGGKLTPTFNIEVLSQRFDLMASKIEKIVAMRRAAAVADELRIVLGGDLVEHETKHPAQWASVELSLFDQAVRVVPAMIARFVRRMARLYPRIRIVYVPGNHGREFGSPAHPRTNWDQVAAEIARMMVVGTIDHPSDLAKRVDWPICESWYVVERVFEWGVLVVHGDQIRGGFGGFPWYGTGRKANGWIDSIPEAWDYMMFGHYHTPMMVTLNHRIALCNGTMESGDERVRAELAAAGHAAQRFVIFDEGEGLIADQMLWLEARTPQSMRRRAAS